MRIDLNTSIPQLPDSGAATQSGGPTTSPAKDGLAADVTRFSWDQVSVQALIAKASQVPEVRQEKVDALAKLVRNGTYRVTAQQTAEALLAHMEVRPAA